MCYLVETIILDNIAYRISELEGALDMMAQPPSLGPSLPLGADEGAVSQGERGTRPQSSSDRHQPYILKLPLQAVHCTSPLCVRGSLIPS